MTKGQTKSPRPGCVDSISWLVVTPHEVKNSNATATKQPCNAWYTGLGGQHAESPITLIFKRGIIAVYFSNVIG